METFNVRVTPWSATKTQKYCKSQHQKKDFFSIWRNLRACQLPKTMHNSVRSNQNNFTLTECKELDREIL